MQQSKMNIVIAGVGGQGILSIAGVIAQAALAAGLRVKQSEVHGMAQRGGAVEAHLRISPDPIFSDLVPIGGAGIVCGMEPMEALRHLPHLNPENGWIVTAAEPLVNIPDYPAVETILAEIRRLPRHLILPVNEMAKAAGNVRSGNMVLLGALSTRLPLPETALLDGIARLFHAKGAAVVDVNLKAFAAGRTAACA